MNATTVENQFRRNLSQDRLFIDPSVRVVIAVSTGVDSMVLLHLLEKSLGHERVIVAHVNHELRKQSTQEETYLQNYCQQHALQLVVTHWPQADHPQTGIEAAARQFRYAFFAQVMADNHVQTLITAHHQNDQAETMLMKLVRGGQLNQLLGIAWQRPFATGRLLRPLLNLSKATLVQYATEQHLTWFEDATNRDLSIVRNQFRHQIIPAMQHVNHQLLDHLSDYRDQLEDTLMLADEVIDQLVVQNCDVQGRLSIAHIAALPAFKRRMVLQRWLEKRWGVTSVHRDQLDQLDTMARNPAKPQTSYDLSQGGHVVKRYQQLIFEAHQVSDQPNDNVHKSGSVLELNQWYTGATRQLIGVFDQAPEADQQVELWLAPEQWPLSVRHWHSQDRIRLKSGHHQTVRRIMIDQKVDQEARAQQVVVVDRNDQVIWVPGRKVAWLSRPDNYVSYWKHVVLAKKDTEVRGEIR